MSGFRESRMVRKLNTLSLILFIALALFISSVGANIYDFEDGIGPGWHYEGKTNWHPDETESHEGNISLQSGEIKCNGTSSIYRYVEGPAVIRFWWKKHPSSGPYGLSSIFTFSVNGTVQQTCDFSNWKKESYVIPENGTYEIRWDFKKITCYPQSEGVGWIDDLNIIPEKPINYTKWSEECICSPGPQGLQGEKGERGEQGMPGAEVDGFNWCGDWDSSTFYSKFDVIGYNGSSYLCIENNSGQEPVNLQYWGLLASKGAEGPQGPTGAKGEKGDVGLKGPRGEKGEDGQPGLQEKKYSLDTIESIIRSNNNNNNRENGSLFIDPPPLGSNLESARDSLERTINSYASKMIYLREGTYPGNISITTHNITISPVENASVKLDGHGSDFVIGLDNASDVSILNLTLYNSTYGIAVENSSYCEVKNNSIINLTNSSNYDACSMIFMNSSYNIIKYNMIGRSLYDNHHGIWLVNSSRNLIKYNGIYNNYNDFYCFKFDNSTDNFIILSSNTFSRGNITVYDNGYKYRLYNMGSVIALSDEDNIIKNGSNEWAII